jgi:hypothetical protein
MARPLGITARVLRVGLSPPRSVASALAPNPRSCIVSETGDPIVTDRNDTIAAE